MDGQYEELSAVHTILVALVSTLLYVNRHRVILISSISKYNEKVTTQLAEKPIAFFRVQHSLIASAHTILQVTEKLSRAFVYYEEHACPRAIMKNHYLLALGLIIGTTWPLKINHDN